VPSSAEGVGDLTDGALRTSIPGGPFHDAVARPIGGGAGRGDSMDAVHVLQSAEAMEYRRRALIPRSGEVFAMATDVDPRFGREDEVPVREIEVFVENEAREEEVVDQRAAEAALRGGGDRRQHGVGERAVVKNARASHEAKALGLCFPDLFAGDDRARRRHAVEAAQQPMPMDVIIVSQNHSTRGHRSRISLSPTKPRYVTPM